MERRTWNLLFTVAIKSSIEGHKKYNFFQTFFESIYIWFIDKKHKENKNCLRLSEYTYNTVKFDYGRWKKRALAFQELSPFLWAIKGLLFSHVSPYNYSDKPWILYPDCYTVSPSHMGSDLLRRCDVSPIDFPSESLQSHLEMAKQKLCFSFIYIFFLSIHVCQWEFSRFCSLSAIRRSKAQAFRNSCTDVTYTAGKKKYEQYSSRAQR